MKPQNFVFARVSIVILSVLFTMALPMIAAAQGKIAFTSNRDGNEEIYVMNSDGVNQKRLTVNTAADRLPSFSPGGGKIAFESDRDGNLEIYVMDPSGGNQTRLTNNSASDSDPAFSSDGTKIVFTSFRDGNWEIYVMNADGSNQLRLTTHSAIDHQPSFSTDGTKIVFSRDADVWAMNSDGSNQTQLTTTPGLDLDAAFSPDGTKIAFRANRGIPVADENVFVMNADGSNQQQLTTSTGPDKEPVFSPDGTKIAFVSVRDGNSEIYVMNPQGGSQTRITNNTQTDNQPAWTDGSLFPPDLNNLSATTSFEGGTTTLTGSIFSPNPNFAYSLTVNWGDGSEQIFNYPAGTTSFSETHSYLDNIFDLPYTINATLTNANGSDSDAAMATLFNAPPSLSVFQPFPAVIGSPITVSGTVSDPGVLDTHTVKINWGDGSQVTTLNLAAGVTNFSANHTYAALGAYTINVSASDDDGGTATPQNIFLGVVPQPTSGKIAFASNFGGNNNIWLMDSNGTNQIPLTQNPASDAYPNLSKNGMKIVFQSGRDGNLEIYSMASNGDFQTRLTNDPGQDTEPVFNPDGSKIVFATNRHGTYEIYIMNSDGTGQTRLTNNSVDDGQAEFSPDGTKIIFARLNGAESHIYTMNLDGTGQTPLTSGFLEINGYPSYSPNGQKIVFSRANLSHTNGEIYVMDANGANAVRLTTAAGNDLEATFSPNGAKIAYRSERDGNAEIYLMDANGANQQRITFDGPGVTNFAPSWAAVPILTVDIADDLAREQGATLTVPIIVSDTTGKGIISYDFTLIFDPAVLQPQASAYEKTGTLSAGFEVNAGSSSPGLLTVSGFGAVPLSGGGTLLNLKFDVIGTPPTSSLLTLHPFMFNEGIPFVDLSSGRVFVQGTIRGSVLYGTSATPTGVPNVLLSAAGSPATSTTTGTDGSYVLGGFGPGSYTVTPTKTGGVNGITALDASLVSQYLVGATTLTANQQAAGEVSGNGTLSSFDAALIAQYVVALPNTGSTGQWRFSPPSRTYLTVGSLTGENFIAILMGEVSGNWSATTGASFSSSLRKTDSAPEAPQSARKPPPAVTLTMPSLKAKTGDVVTVGVTLSQLSSTLQAYQFDVLYDPQVLQLDATPVNTAGTLSNSLAAVTNGQTPGRLRLAVYGSNLISSNGTLINLRFRVIGANGSSSSLSFGNLMLNEGSPASEGKSGKITAAKR